MVRTGSIRADVARYSEERGISARDARRLAEDDNSHAAARSVYRQ